MKGSKLIGTVLTSFYKVYWCRIWGLHEWVANNDPDLNNRSCCSRCGKTSVYSLEFENEVKSNMLKNEKRS
jgi:hypothetical protein